MVKIIDLSLNVNILIMQVQDSSAEAFNVLVVCISFRILIALLLRSTFHPDEYYQTLEPAFYVSHDKKSWFELTWEWDYSMRSFNGIIHYILYFKLCKYLNMDGFRTAMVAGPRIMQAILSGVADYFYYKISLRISKKKSIATSCLFVHLLSWSSIYFYSRTLINVLESNLFIMYIYMSTNRDETSNGNKIIQKMNYNAIFRYPFIFRNMNYSMILLMVYTIHIRPTAFILFIPLTFMIVHNNASKTLYISKVLLFGFKYTLIIILAAALLTIIDCHFYGRRVYPPYSFYFINITRGFASTFFGDKPFYWYITSSIPAILGIFFPVFIYGIVFVRLDTKHYEFYWLLGLAFFVVVILSVVSKHKEIRFLLPILPIFHMYIGAVVERVFIHGAKTSRRIFMSYIAVGVVLQLIVTIYLLFFHQVGTEKSFSYLSDFVKRTYSTNSNVSIHILSPCHAFPGYSHITAPKINVLIQEPDCYPTLNYFTESQLFEQSSFKFWKQKLENSDMISDILISQIITAYRLPPNSQGTKFATIDNHKLKRYVSLSYFL